MVVSKVVVEYQHQYTIYLPLASPSEVSYSIVDAIMYISRLNP